MTLLSDMRQDVLDSTVEIKGDGKNYSCEFKSDRPVTTVEEVFHKSGADPKIWRVKDFTCKAWQVGMKVRKGDVDVPHKENLWAVSARFERMHPEGIEDALALLKAWNPPRPTIPKMSRSKARDRHMLELDLFDVHFGKYAWGEETGTDYDTDIASMLFSEAISDLLLKTGGYNVNRILIPVGNDFFQADNWEGTTTKGTKVDHDGRFPRVFEVGFKSVVNAVNACLQVAPVKLIYVPGNHDTTTSWYLSHSLKSWFRSVKHVDVDTSPKQRKYETYGNTLLGFAHGDKMKKEKLLGLMATEASEQWASSQFREIHTGHFHKAMLDEELGVRIRTLSALTATDSWHFNSGYVGSIRAAEAYLWSEDDGLSCQVYSNVKS